MERISDKNNIGVVRSAKECYNNTQKPGACNGRWEDRRQRVPRALVSPVVAAGARDEGRWGRPRAGTSQPDPPPTCSSGHLRGSCPALRADISFSCLVCCWRLFPNTPAGARWGETSSGSGRRCSWPPVLAAGRGWYRGGVTVSRSSGLFRLGNSPPLWDKAMRSLILRSCLVCSTAFVWEGASNSLGNA